MPGDFYYDDWNENEINTIRTLRKYIHQKPHKSDKTHSSDTEIKPEDIDKEIVQKIVDERRHNLMVELLRPFPIGPEDQKDFHIFGRISHFEELENGYIRIIFEASTEDMYAFRSKLLKNYFELKEAKDDPKDYCCYQKQNNLNDPVIDALSYPYEYYYELDVDRETAARNNWLISSEKLEYVCDKDEGTIVFTNDPEIRQRLETENAHFQIKKLSERPEDIVYKDYLISSHRFKIKLENFKKETEYNPKAINPHGRLCFIDDVEENSADVASSTIYDPSDHIPHRCVTDNSSPNVRNLWNDLFEDYGFSHIYLYNVGFGQCIAVEISYSKNSGKPDNLLIIDDGTNTRSPHYSSYSTRVAVENDLVDKCETTWKNHGKVYFVLTHDHIDHYFNYYDLFKKLRANNHTQQLKDSICIFPHNTFDDDVFYPSAIKYITPYIIEEELGTVISVGDIKICQGNTSVERQLHKEFWENYTSIMFQLSKTLLTADCYFHSWPDEFGKDSNGNDKFFDDIVLPHHGYVSSDPKSQSVVDRICKPTSRLYVSRDDPGDVDGVLQRLGIDQNPLTKTYALPSGKIYAHILDM